MKSSRPARPSSCAPRSLLEVKTSGSCRYESDMPLLCDKRQDISISVRGRTARDRPENAMNHLIGKRETAPSLRQPHHAAVSL